MTLFLKRIHAEYHLVIKHICSSGSFSSRYRYRWYFKAIVLLTTLFILLSTQHIMAAGSSKNLFRIIDRPSTKSLYSRDDYKKARYIPVSNGFHTEAPAPGVLLSAIPLKAQRVLPVQPGMLLAFSGSVTRQNPRLLNVDTGTGEGAVRVALPPQDFIFDMTFRPDGTLFGTARLFADEQTNRLVMIDPNSGAVTLVTDMEARINEFEFIGSTLYGLVIDADGNPSLVTIDQDRGNITTIGEIRLDSGFLLGLAYDTASDTLYGVTALGDPSQIIAINPETAAVMPIAPISGVSAVLDVDFAPDGTLFAVGLLAGDPRRHLLILDPETGAGASVGPITGFLSTAAMAFVPMPMGSSLSRFTTYNDLASD